MASLVRETKNGRTRFRVQFFDKNGDRRSVRLGANVNERAAERIAERIDMLVAHSIGGGGMDSDLAGWVRKLGRELADKLANADLIPKRQSAKLAAFVDHYIESRTDLQPNTRRNFKNTRNRLVAFFGADRDLRTITEGEAHDWRQKMVQAGTAEATISKAVKQAKHFFALAVTKQLVDDNPLRKLKGGSERNEGRMAFISRETIDLVLDAAPDAEWRAIIALSRFGGIRCPSETLSLKWSDIDWARNRMIVSSPKTAKSGKAYREVPIYPELRPYLEDAEAVAKDGAVYVIDRYRDAKDQNLRTGFLRIIRRAGVQPWERLFHNLRASRQTELTNQFPAHVVAEWQGNTVTIAERHYLQTLDSHFEQAAGGGAEGGAQVVQKVVRHGIALNRTETTAQQKAPAKPGLVLLNSQFGDSVPNCHVLPTGDEQVGETPENDGNLGVGGAGGGAVPAQSADLNADLQTVVDAWPTLPPTVRKAIRDLAAKARRTHS